eukprot:gnl/TRDRNA2_/TRDRNA2_34380_c0_seq1.p1 gnl/TRDRNA2_/TRDRNA2_34380_c0~~gnl/TRDRNA2_/TRDRNA2_34380_c0_seq1.p1  ORF type:complete len:188 (+),score=10.65 gnl/TRDRNA2_/TRDRNA2_34380_c0_seq1:59-622(+)
MALRKELRYPSVRGVVSSALPPRDAHEDDPLRLTSDPNPGAVISDDHADASLCAEGMAPAARTAQQNLRPRPISPEEVKKHNHSAGSFWAVVDGFVVDATEFVESHPGGMKKILSADSPGAGATGGPFGFSFSRGRNAHFPETGRRFRDGVERYLNCTKSQSDFLPPADVGFPPYGKIVIVGKLEHS